MITPHNPIDEVYHVYQALTALHRLTRPTVDAAELEPQVGVLIGLLADKLWWAYAHLLGAREVCRCGQPRRKEHEGWPSSPNSSPTSWTASRRCARPAWTRPPASSGSR